MRKLLTALLMLGACAGCASAGSQTPPAAHGTSGAQQLVAPGDAGRHGPAGDLPAGARLDLTWIPNINWKHARQVHRTGSARQGRTLLRDIRNAPVVAKPRTYMCPLDSGAAVRLASGSTRVTVPLMGCRFVQIGRTAHRTDAAVVHDLRALAPHRWLQYLPAHWT